MYALFWVPFPSIYVALAKISFSSGSSVFFISWARLHVHHRLFLASFQFFCPYFKCDLTLSESLYPKVTDTGEMIRMYYGAQLLYPLLLTFLRLIVFSWRPLCLTGLSDGRLPSVRRPGVVPSRRGVCWLEAWPLQTFFFYTSCKV